jgi:hypothetical protein
MRIAVLPYSRFFALIRGYRFLIRVLLRGNFPAA